MSEKQAKSDAPAASEMSLGVEGIMQRIPHRYPFLMIDRVEHMVLDDSAIGIKNVTINEPYFPGHFPGRPVMPGVLIIEAMAQTAGVLVVETVKSPAAGKIVYFMTIDDARFRRPVVPGDRLELHMKKLRNRGTVWKFTGQAKVRGIVVAETTISAMIVDE